MLLHRATRTSHCANCAASRSAGVSGRIGAYAAPVRSTASCATSWPTVRWHRMLTTSPGFTPWATSRRATAVTRCSSCSADSHEPSAASTLPTVGTPRTSCRIASVGWAAVPCVVRRCARSSSSNTGRSCSLVSGVAAAVNSTRLMRRAMWAMVASSNSAESNSMASCAGRSADGSSEPKNTSTFMSKRDTSGLSGRIVAVTPSGAGNADGRFCRPIPTVASG